MLPTALELSDMSSMAILILLRRIRVTRRIMTSRAMLRMKNASQVSFSFR